MGIINIGKRVIGPGHPCFIVAEISGNHHQKYEEAVELLKAAKDAGVDAVKLQTYTPDTITLNSDKGWFRVEGKDHPESWKGQTLYNLYEKAYTPWEWQPKLKKIANELGLILFSTPFDETAVDFLEGMDVPCYKIASYEAIHIPLLKKVAQTGKPVIISVGFADLEEVTIAIDTLNNNGAKDIVVLHCVTSYSDRPNLKDMNLFTIPDIRRRFNVLAGFSDNNTGIAAPVIAVVKAGAVVVEKHLILNRSDGGPDARFSMDPQEFKEMVRIIRKGEIGSADSVLGADVTRNDVDKAMGQVHYGPASPQEEENIVFRPSIWVKKDIKAGEIFSKENICVARPSAGLRPKFFYDILGKSARCSIEEITPLDWGLINK